MKATALTKKLGALVLCGTLLAGALTIPAAALSRVNAQISPYLTILVDGTERTFYNVNGQEVQPILYGGTTYLPVRAIGELMGKNVDWNESTRTVTLAGTRTTAAVTGTPDTAARTASVTAEIRDDFTIIVDGQTRTFYDAAGNRVYPLLYGGSTYLPLRAIGELMGKTVSWDGATSTASLTGGTLVTDADSFSGGSGGTGTSTGGLTLSRSDFTLNTTWPTYTFTVTGASGTVTWSSSNTAVATVDANGTVTRQGTGSCTVTATDSAGNTATCIVAKNRHGSTGDVTIGWQGEYTRFFNLEMNREAPPF